MESLKDCLPRISGVKISDIPIPIIDFEDTLIWKYTRDGKVFEKSTIWANNNSIRRTRKQSTQRSLEIDSKTEVVIICLEIFEKNPSE